MRKIDVAVIGAGQAGLATSFNLSQSGIDHVVFDRAVVADSWRSRRWDSFRLNIPNWSFMLPGFPYDGCAMATLTRRRESAGILVCSSWGYS